MKKKKVSKRPVKSRVRYRDLRYLVCLGKRIRKVRRSKGYSIDRLSLESEHLSRATISRIEQGKSDPQVSTLRRIAETLGVPTSFLLELGRES